MGQSHRPSGAAPKGSITSIALGAIAYRLRAVYKVIWNAVVKICM
jgi:hypothetical protein